MRRQRAHSHPGRLVMDGLRPLFDAWERKKIVRLPADRRPRR
jgi:hypothetical protein